MIASLLEDNQADNEESAMHELRSFSINYLTEKRQDDELDNDTVKLLTTLNRMIKELKATKENDIKAYYSTDSVLEYFKGQEEYSWLESKTWLTKKLKKLEIKVEFIKQENRSQRAYSLEKRVFNDYLARYTSIAPPKDLEKTLINMFDLEEVVPF